MGVISGDDVAALEHQADDRPFARFFREIVPAFRPVQIFLEVLEHRGGQGVPDAQVWEDLRLSNLHGRAVIPFGWREDIFIRKHQEEVAEVVRRSTQPVLEAEHEAAGVLSLFDRQILENRWQRVQQLEHRVLETGTPGLLAFFMEAGDGALALAELGHGEAAQLVQPHHLRHRWKHHRCLEPIPVRSDGVNDLLGQVFDEDQRCNKDIGLSDIRAEIGVIVVIPKLFDQVTAELDAEVATGRIQGCRSLRQGVLVLGLQNHVHRFHHGLVVLTIHRGNAAIGGADLCEHLRGLSNVKNDTATGNIGARISGRPLHECPHRL